MRRRTPDRRGRRTRGLIACGNQRAHCRVVEYIYPLKTDGKGTRTLEEFSVKLTIKSQHPIQTVYSPTHAIDLKRKGDHEVAVEFEKNQAILDKDFQLFYGLGKQDIGLTPLVYRPVTSEDGYFMLLISPQVEPH